MNQQHNSIPVIAINVETGKEVGEFESFSKCTRSLFITDRGCSKLQNYFRTTSKNPIKDKWGTTSYIFKLKSEK